MTLVVLGVGFFVPFVAIKTVLAQLMLRFERDDAFWVALAGHCGSVVMGAPLLTLIWGALQNAALFQISYHTPPSVFAVALFYGCLVIPFDVWTAQGIIRNGSYPDLDDAHPCNTITRRLGVTTLRLAIAWALITNLICISGGIFAMRLFGSSP
ncbi:hypothetical protein IAD21_01665 [Abditibacteriota bacterium]|nr:hypothetical protein IAD21_01665 [Abditibacteriota bacterium]